MTKIRGTAKTINECFDAVDRVAGIDMVPSVPAAIDPNHRAYRVEGKNGSQVLCREHLELARVAAEPDALRFTGENFDAALCDVCLEASEL